jgi:hypothetical protein
MPRCRVADRQNERQRIQFAFNADLDSAIGVMFNDLIKNPKAPSRAGKHKGVGAMLALWKQYQVHGNKVPLAPMSQYVRSTVMKAVQKTERFSQQKSAERSVQRQPGVELE